LNGKLSGGPLTDRAGPGAVEEAHGGFNDQQVGAH
jgi:hypothetical protein